MGSGTYKYYAAVFDDKNQETYTDDPKIIVGGGVEDVQAEIGSALNDLKRAEEKLSSKHKLQEQVKSVEHKLEHILGELK